MLLNFSEHRGINGKFWRKKKTWNGYAMVISPHLYSDLGVAMELSGHSTMSSMHSHRKLTACSCGRSTVRALCSRLKVSVQIPLTPTLLYCAPSARPPRAHSPIGDLTALLQWSYSFPTACLSENAERWRSLWAWSKYVPRHGVLGDLTTSMEMACICCSIATAI